MPGWESGGLFPNGRPAAKAPFVLAPGPPECPAAVGIGSVRILCREGTSDRSAGPYKVLCLRGCLGQALRTGLCQRGTVHPSPEQLSGKPSDQVSQGPMG